MADTSFVDLKLNSWIIRQCAAIGVKHPTPIQTNCIPHILDGEDCIGCAKTGSGKTLAFALPILQKLCEDPFGIFALVLTPTRELAFQIADQFAVIGKSINIRQCVVVGGMPMIDQAQELARKPHIVVATPGRLADHLNSCDTFTLKKIKFLVLDEADRLLIGSFDDQLTTIFAALPEKKQSLLFSATITDTLEKVREVASNKVFLWESNEAVATVSELEQFYVLCPADIKDGYLVETIRTFRQTSEHGSIIIFTDTCRNCQLISMTLNEVGIENMALHAMIPQRQRLAGLAMFKSNNIKILIATDVASRGLDIPAVELVLNYTVPSVPKDYIHRVGRTARAGRDGMAISLVTPYDIRLIHAIEATINTKLREYVIDGMEVAKIFTQVSVTKREAAIKLDDSNFDERKLNFKRKNMILEGKDPDEEESKLKKLKKKEKQKYNKSRESNHNTFPVDDVHGEEAVNEATHVERNTDEEERKLKKKEKQKYNKSRESNNTFQDDVYQQECMNLDESKHERKFNFKSQNVILKRKDIDVEERKMKKKKEKQTSKMSKNIFPEEDDNYDQEAAIIKLDNSNFERGKVHLGKKKKTV